MKRLSVVWSKMEWKDIDRFGRCSLLGRRQWMGMMWAKVVVVMVQNRWLFSWLAMGQNYLVIAAIVTEQREFLRIGDFSVYLLQSFLHSSSGLFVLWYAVRPNDHVIICPRCQRAISFRDGGVDELQNIIWWKLNWHLIGKVYEIFHGRLSRFMDTVCFPLVSVPMNRFGSLVSWFSFRDSFFQVGYVRFY